MRVSIPQAVSTVATEEKKECIDAAIQSVSIPQAVSTVATHFIDSTTKEVGRVSIPQAVSTVATIPSRYFITSAS